MKRPYIMLTAVALIAVLALIITAGCTIPQQTEASSPFIGTWHIGAFEEENLSYTGADIILSENDIGAIKLYLPNGDYQYYSFIWSEAKDSTTEFGVLFSYWFYTLSDDGLYMTKTEIGDHIKTDNTPGLVGTWKSSDGLHSEIFYDNGTGIVDSWEGKVLEDPIKMIYYPFNGNTYLVAYYDGISGLGFTKQADDTLIDSDGGTWTRVE